MKPIRLSRHAQLRALQRGATEDEIVNAVRQSPPMCAEGGKVLTRKTFLFEGISPANGVYYRLKTVEPVFANEAEEIVVVTVKVYYSDEGKDA